MLFMWREYAVYRLKASRLLVVLHFLSRIEVFFPIFAKENSEMIGEKTVGFKENIFLEVTFGWNTKSGFPMSLFEFPSV